MAPAIPDRWLDYQPVGKVIEGTRFVAFKVPLRADVLNSVPENLRLTCESLLKKIPKLGMIIDLTNTYRYYNPEDFRDKGVIHEKLMIPGHEVPPKHLADRFNMLANNFLQENSDNDKLIGVHCTHGVNRTGYLISNFMISELKMTPEKAIRLFGEAREHTIERVNYRDHLLGNIACPSQYKDWRNQNHSYGDRSKQSNVHIFFDDNLEPISCKKPIENNTNYVERTRYNLEPPAFNKPNENWRQSQLYSTSKPDEYNRSYKERTRYTVGRDGNYRTNPYERNNRHNNSHPHRNSYYKYERQNSEHNSYSYE